MNQAAHEKRADAAADKDCLNGCRTGRRRVVEAMLTKMLRILPIVLSLSLSGTLLAADAGLDRTVLPVAEPDPPRSTVLDARDATPPPRFEVKAPVDSPNVLIVLVDDMAFGIPSAFGGPARMPSADGLAKQGLRYNQFHTTAVYSPTRVALLTGQRPASKVLASA